ncbi:MAG TPA: glycosyltransferase family 2 protein [Candidatus Methylomirabilis sp.]|nr:glycosyltransferase family 2 protein [Candidatus Methylomirabilis sp.]
MAFTLTEAAASLVLAFWLWAAWMCWRGQKRLPYLAPAEGSPGSHATLSVIIPCRNEADALPRSVPSLIDQTYPNLEVILLDDRSTDGTGQVLQSLAQTCSRLRTIQIRTLPEGWLGKTHALWIGSQQARGSWLLFTDADVIFHPQCVEAAVTHAETHQLDHLVVIPRVETVGFWETILVSCFGLLFDLALRPWQVSNPRSSAHIGIGAFNLIRHSAYLAIGTHRALANAIVDDLELGRRVKQAGLRQAAVRAGDLLRVRWQVGLSGVVSGLEKNAFAGVGFSLLLASATCIALAGLGILPFVGAMVGPARGLWAAAALTVSALQAAHSRNAGLPAWSGPFHPLATAVLIYAVARSTFMALHRGSVVWRGTSYPLTSLRRPPPVLETARTKH